MSESTGPVSLVTWTCLGLALAWAGLRWFERASIYIPSRVIDAHPGSFGLPYDELSLRPGEGLTLHGWFLDAGAPERKTLPLEPALRAEPLQLPAGPRPVVVIFHGNGGNISHRLGKARAFRAMGLSVLLFDYRGYGRSGGRPSERGLYRDGEAAAAEALDRAGGDPSRVFYYGESLGCAVALETALRRPPAALVLDSPFASTVEMAALVLPWFPARWLARDRYDNRAKVRGLSVPLLVVHSPEDDVIPFAQGREVFGAAPEPRQFFEGRGGHNEGFLETPGWAKTIRDFYQPTLAPR